MSEIRLSGSIGSAFSHLALAGLAAIVQSAVGAAVRFLWSDGVGSVPILTTPVSQQQVAEIVRLHAEGHTNPGDWVNLTIDSGTRAGNRLFTARAKSFKTSSEWRGYVRARRMAIEELRSKWSPLDERMLVGLGESAWWRCDDKQSRPDDGASRWEMKTRNRGEEFLANRLSLLAAAVAARSEEQVLDGLTGRIVVDEVGKNNAESRTPTGLATPRATDNALAWCALWGISAAPTIPRLEHDGVSRGMAQSPGTWPRQRVHPGWYALPVYSTPVTVGRWSAVLSSRPFDRAVRGLPGVDDISAQETDVLVVRGWLREQGVRALVLFPTRVVGSSSAPERQLLSGQVFPL